jgi:hypothetical protein
MNERIKLLAEQATLAVTKPDGHYIVQAWQAKFAELIVREVCGMMEQAEDDAYHCFEPSERPTEYIEWLRDWQERFTKHFGVEE